MSGQAPGQRAAREDAEARRTGIVPVAAVTSLLSDLDSAEPARLVAASRRIDALAADRRLLEALARSIPAHQLIRARAIALYAGRDLSAERIVALGDRRLAEGAAALEQRRSQEAAAAEAVRASADKSVEAQFCGEVCPGELGEV